jgi:hypothetical protein
VDEDFVIPKHLVAHIIDQKSLFTYDNKIDKECQQFPAHLTAPNSYDVFSIYDMSLAEQEDNIVVKVADLIQKQFYHPFHEDIRPIVHEESNLTYGSCGSKLQPSFEKKIFISTWIIHIATY